MIKSLFASSMVALLLSVSALAAACDINCSFASMNSDCHSQQTILQDSPSSTMNMSGMNMAGMTLPKTANGGDPQSVSPMAEKASGHPTIGEMGPCEEQACDTSSAISTRTSRCEAPQFHCVPAFIGTPRVTGASPHFHDAREDVAFSFFPDMSPLNHTLRI